MPDVRNEPMSDEADDERRRRIRDAGLRCTPARLAVLRHLEESGAPLTHGDLVDALREGGFDQSTIYRNLTDLADAGLVLRRELGDHVWRFESFRPGESHADSHAHFLCVGCGSVRCLPEVRLDQPSRVAAAKVGDVTEVLIKGRCAGCGPKA